MFSFTNDFPRLISGTKLQCQGAGQALGLAVNYTALNWIFVNARYFSGLLSK